MYSRTVMPYTQVCRLPYSPNPNTTVTSMDGIATGIGKAIKSKPGQDVAKLSLINNYGSGIFSQLYAF